MTSTITQQRSNLPFPYFYYFLKPFYCDIDKDIYIFYIYFFPPQQPSPASYNSHHNDTSVSADALSFIIIIMQTSSPKTTVQSPLLVLEKLSFHKYVMHVYIKSIRQSFTVLERLLGAAFFAFFFFLSLFLYAESAIPNQRFFWNSTTCHETHFLSENPFPTS